MEEFNHSLIENIEINEVGENEAIEKCLKEHKQLSYMLFKLVYIVSKV